MRAKDNIIKGQRFETSNITCEVIAVWWSAGQISKVEFRNINNRGPIHERTGGQFYKAMKEGKIKLI